MFVQRRGREKWSAQLTLIVCQICPDCTSKPGWPGIPQPFKTNLNLCLYLATNGDSMFLTSNNAICYDISGCILCLKKFLQVFFFLPNPLKIRYLSLVDLSWSAF